MRVEDQLCYYRSIRVFFPEVRGWKIGMQFAFDIPVTMQFQKFSRPDEDDQSVSSLLWLYKLDLATSLYIEQYPFQLGYNVIKFDNISPVNTVWLLIAKWDAVL